MTVPRLNTAGRFDPAALFRPASIAVIGAETEAGSQIMANLAMGGFKGEVHTQPGPKHVPRRPGDATGPNRHRR